MTHRTGPIAAVVTACFCGTFAAAQRLPSSVVPDHYALRMSPDIAGATFSGTETIDVTLSAPTNSITLNALELKITSASVGTETGAVTYDVASEQATITFAHALPAGKTALQLAFTGVLNDKLRGFYLSKTKARNYAVTQFESTDARRAFPNFDEPALKATFDVALTIDKRDTAISNADVLSDTDAGNGKHTLVFRTTPRMSTYLVAFLVGDFACTKGKAEGIPIRVCSTPDKVNLTRFGLKSAEHFLSYYDKYFGIKYPMPKLDLIAIPDFEAGAMENFGAITYRETELLLDEKESSINAKKKVSSVVAHEMAHQWFGDMVTMRWWDNLWLNEGFATWMASKASNEWHPEWNFPQDDAQELNGTLNYDSEPTTRAIRAAAETPAQIAEMFDGIAYGKAGAVLGMVENWVGPEVFRQGVHNYLAAHLYNNATAEDFWSAETAAAKLPVDEVMSSYVNLPGVPLLTFAGAQPGKLTIGQSRFFLSQPAQPVAAAAQRGGWAIPMCYKASGKTNCELLKPNAANAQAAPDEFAYANAGAKGYYRVAYTPAQLRDLTARAATLTVPERINFVGDRWALTRAGQGTVGEFLDLALALKNDPSSQVLDSVLSTIGAIRARVASNEDRVKLDAVVRAQFGPVYASLGDASKRGDYDQQQRRTELYGALGEAADPAILAHAQQLTDDLFAGRKVSEPDVLDASVGLAAGSGDAAMYDRILVVSQKAVDPGLQSEALQVLTRFHAPALVIRTLEYAVSGQVRNQDSWILIASELAQSESRELAWAWVQRHWGLVKAQLTTASGSNVVGSTGSFCTGQGRNEVRDFFATHKVEASERALTKSLEQIDACIKFRSAQEPNLHAWLDKNAH